MKVTLGKLYELRKEIGLTQEQVATAMGQSQASISRLERSANIRYNTLLRYCRALGGELCIRIVSKSKEQANE